MKDKRALVGWSYVKGSHEEMRGTQMKAHHDINQPTWLLGTER
jgi:hypothetical protein